MLGGGAPLSEQPVPLHAPPFEPSGRHLYRGPFYRGTTGLTEGLTQINKRVNGNSTLAIREIA
jgi:hypothetical protein